MSKRSRPSELAEQFDLARRLIFGDEAIIPDTGGRSAYTTAGFIRFPRKNIKLQLGPFTFEFDSLADYYRVYIIRHNNIELKGVGVELCRIETDRIVAYFESTIMNDSIFSNYNIYSQTVQTKLSDYNQHELMYNVFASFPAPSSAYDKKNQNLIAWRNAEAKFVHPETTENELLSQMRALVAENSNDSGYQVALPISSNSKNKELIIDCSRADTLIKDEVQRVTYAVEHINNRMYVKAAGYIHLSTFDEYPARPFHPTTPQHDACVLDSDRSLFYIADNVRIACEALAWLMHVLTGPGKENWPAQQQQQQSSERKKEDSEPSVEKWFQFRDNGNAQQLYLTDPDNSKIEKKKPRHYKIPVHELTLFFYRPLASMEQYEKIVERVEAFLRRAPAALQGDAEALERNYQDRRVKYLRGLYDQPYKEGAEYDRNKAPYTLKQYKEASAEIAKRRKVEFMGKCAACGAEAAAAACGGGCGGAVRYCDRECQRSHWADHKESCK